MSREFASRPGWQIALVLTAVLRLLYTSMAVIFFPFLHTDPALIHSNALTANLPAPHGLHYALLGIWQRFDTLWYLDIAEHGYHKAMEVIFYPLYPAAIRLLNAVLQISAMAAAMVVSTVAAFFFFWGILRLADSELSNVARIRMLWLLCVWPTSFMLFAGYAESLTMALLVWAVIFGRAARWEAATACGLLAGLARPPGLLIFIPLALLALRSRQARALIVALTPLGLVGYWGWLRWSGRISVVEAYPAYWSTQVSTPWATIFQIVASLAKHLDALVLVNLIALIVMFLAGISARRRSEDRLFSATTIAQILMRMCSPALLGTPRYLMLVYPGFLTMGNWAEKMHWRHFAFLCTTLFLFNTVWLWAFLNWSLVL